MKGSLYANKLLSAVTTRDAGLRTTTPSVPSRTIFLPPRSYVSSRAPANSSSREQGKQWEGPLAEV
jgi:hypothetical protein